MALWRAVCMVELENQSCMPACVAPVHEDGIKPGHNTVIAEVKYCCQYQKTGRWLERMRFNIQYLFDMLTRSVDMGEETCV